MPLVSFTVALIFSTVCVLALGFLIASLVPTARFAQPIGTLVLYAMFGLSGLFVPVESLPAWLQAIARVLPITHAVALLRGVWHGGPFARTRRYVFFPKQIMFATDPVAIDRLLLDIIDDERKRQGAISIWDRSPSSLRMDDGRARDADPDAQGGALGPVVAS